MPSFLCADCHEHFIRIVTDCADRQGKSSLLNFKVSVSSETIIESRILTALNMNEYTPQFKGEFFFLTFTFRKTSRSSVIIDTDFVR